VLANDQNFVETVQEWFDEEDLSAVDAEVNSNEPILTSYQDTNSELSKSDDTKGYIEESSLSDEDNSFRKAFYGRNRFKCTAEEFVSRSIIQLPGLRPPARIGTQAQPLQLWNLLIIDGMLQDTV
jgi:hypothetical protein